MNPNEYQKLALKKMADQDAIFKSRQLKGTRAVQFDNAITGLTDEIGELASVKKQWLEYGGPAPDVVNILEEAGDIFWRTCQLLDTFDLTMQQAMEANLKKLDVRYEGKFTQEEAKETNRDREAEAKAMAEYPKTLVIIDEADSVEPDWMKATREENSKEKGVVTLKEDNRSLKRAEDDGVDYSKNPKSWTKKDRSRYKAMVDTTGKTAWLDAEIFKLTGIKIKKSDNVFVQIADGSRLRLTGKQRKKVISRMMSGTVDNKSPNTRIIKWCIQST